MEENRDQVPSEKPLANTRPGVGTVTITVANIH